MTKHIKVNSISTAWEVAASIFPTDYQKRRGKQQKSRLSDLQDDLNGREFFRIPHFRPQHSIRGKHGSRNGDDLGRGK